MSVFQHPNSTAMRQGLNMQHPTTPQGASARPRPAWAVLFHGAASLCCTAAALITIWLPQPSLAQQSPATAAPTMSHEQLFERAKQWVMNNQQVAADQVQFANLDSRVRVAQCAQPLQFDYPFSVSFETIRVRCSQPVTWQLFLRVIGPAAAARPNPVVAAATAAPRPAPAAPVIAQPPAMKTTVVAKQLLQRGTELHPSMLEEVQRPALGLDPLALSSLKDLQRAEVVRDIPAGTVLRSYDIKRTLMVRKGQAATLTVGQGAGFQISVRVEAEQDGHLGEQIRLKNPESGRLISGVVTGPNALKGL